MMFGMQKVSSVVASILDWVEDLNRCPETRMQWEGYPLLRRICYKITLMLSICLHQWGWSYDVLLFI